MRSPIRRTLVLLAGLFGLFALAAPTLAAEQASPRCHTDCLRVYSIKMYDYLGPDAEAHVKVVDENGGAIRGAVVHGVWTLPDGSTLDRYDVIGTRLRAEFPLYTDQSGTVTFTVTGISVAGYTFDPAGSNVLSASIDVAGDPGSGSCVTDCVRVASITMSERKGDVRAVIVVTDEDATAVRRANVTATWTLPDGTQTQQAVTTNRRGKGRLAVDGVGAGVYTITIDAVSATGLAYDPDGGVTTASYTVD